MCPTQTCEQLYTPRAVFEFDEDVRVEVERLSEAVERRRDPSELQPGHVGDRVLDVRADVADAVRDARDLGILAPRGELEHRVAALADVVDQIFLEIFRVDVDDLADDAPADQRPRLLDHDVAGVGVVDAEEKPALLGDPAELLGLFDREAERLLAEDVDPMREERFCRRVVRVVRGGDDDEIDPILPRRLTLRHRLPVAVDARGIEAVEIPGLAVCLFVPAEAARGKTRPSVERDANPVDAADERAERAADLTVLQCFFHDHTSFYSVSIIQDRARFVKTDADF